MPPWLVSPLLPKNFRRTSLGCARPIREVEHEANVDPRGDGQLAHRDLLDVDPPAAPGQPARSALDERNPPRRKRPAVVRNRELLVLDPRLRFTEHSFARRQR